ncbi:MAG TPA: response regulator [Bacillota bacterium]
MGKNIMVVDDAIIIRLMMKKILTEAGYNVIGEASTGAMAIRKYRELQPDLVMMDITMPEMSGISALKAIRELDPAAKVVICSALGQKKLILEAMEAGATNFIIKPFEPDQVVTAVGQALGA